MTAAIRLGGKNVVYTQTIVSSGDETIEIAPFADNFDEYFIRIKFLRDENAIDEMKFIHYPEGNIRVIEITNSVSEVAANIDPQYVANFKGKKIFLDFCTRQVGPISTFKRLTTLTLSEGGDVDA